MLNLKKNNINLYKVFIYNKIDNAINTNTFSDYISNLINNNPSTLIHTINNDIYYLRDDNIHFSKWLIKKIKLKIENIDVIKYKLYNSLGLFCEYNELELNNDTNNKKLEINKLLYKKIYKMYPNLFYLWLKINLVKNRENYIFKITKLNTYDLTGKYIFKFNNNFKIISVLDTIKPNIKLIYNFFSDLICKLNTPYLPLSLQTLSSDYQSLSILPLCNINKLEFMDKNLNSFEILKLLCNTLKKLNNNKNNNILSLINETVNKTVDKINLSIKSFLDFLNSLLDKDIPYYYVEKIFAGDTKLYRGWYFLPIRNKENIIYILKIFGCNCIDLINICRIRFNLQPVFKNFEGFEPYIGSYIYKIIYELIDNENLRKLSKTNFTDENNKSLLDNDNIHDYYGSYRMWYHFFNKDKYIIDDILNIFYDTDDISEKLLPGTLLIASTEYNHVAIISEIKDNIIYIIHSYPDILDAYNSKTGFESPGIQKDNLKEIILEWRKVSGYNKFNFKLAIPFEEWMCYRDLELK